MSRRTDVLRFGARSAEGRYSSLWFARRSGSDLYLGLRSLGGKFKLSLHKDGNAQVSVTYEHFAGLPNEGVPPPPSRHFTRWRMPQLSDTGAVHVASVVFPSRFLAPGPAPCPTERVYWLAAPENGAVELGLFYTRVLPHKMRFEHGARPRLTTSLQDGRFVLAVTRETEFDEARVLGGFLGQRRVYALSRELWESHPGDVLAGCAGFLWSDVRDGGAVVIWDIRGVDIRRDA